MKAFYKRICAAVAVLLALFFLLGGCDFSGFGADAGGEGAAEDEIDGNETAGAYTPDARVSCMLRSTLNEEQQQAYDLLQAQLYGCPERVRLTKLSEEELHEVLSALRGDNPLLFFLKSAYSYSTETLTGRVTLLPDYTDTPENCRRRLDELLNKARSIVAEMPPEASDVFEKELWLHDRLCESCVYASGENDATAYGALIEGKAVCEGYAMAAKLLFDLAGLDSCVVSGEGRPEGELPESHMWNAVEIDGSWYYLDCTWDDPVMTDGGDVVRHFYFNLDASLMENSHVSDHIPAFLHCDDTRQNYFRRMGLYCGEADWQDIFEDVLSEVGAGESVELMCADAGLLDEIAASLFDRAGIWDLAPGDREWTRFTYSVDRNTNCLYLQFEA